MQSSEWLFVIKNSAEFPQQRNQHAKHVEIIGHIIDSLILTKVLDLILSKGSRFLIETINVGEKTEDPSYARIEVKSETPEILQATLDEIRPHGAIPLEPKPNGD